jgi:hypothetical protein
MPPNQDYRRVCSSNSVRAATGLVRSCITSLGEVVIGEDMLTYNSSLGHSMHQHKRIWLAHSV